MSHSMESYEREDGKRGWRIKSGDDVVATDGNQGYNNEEDALDGLFGIFFGAYDDSFLELYAKWQSYAGQKGKDVPEPYVREAKNEQIQQIDAGSGGDWAGVPLAATEGEGPGGAV